MTDADSFYDKLLASIGLPPDEPTPQKEPSRDHGRNDFNERLQTPKPPPEPQRQPRPDHQPPSNSKPELPQSKSKSEPRPKSKPKSKPGPEPELVLRRNSGPAPINPTPSAVELRDKLQSLARQSAASTPAPPTPPTAASKLPSKPPRPIPPPQENSQPREEESQKTPAALEAELRRKLLENGLRKRKSSPPEGRTPKANGIDKRRKTTPPPVASLPIPPLPLPLSLSVTPATTEIGSTGPKEQSTAPDTDLIKSRQAELRRKLLERSNLIKQKPPTIETNGNPPNCTFDLTNRPYSPIEISSDEDESPSSTPKSKILSSLPPFLPPRPPPREGFKLRISVPFSAAPSGRIALKTEKLPLSTQISTILGLFGVAKDGDHLYFPGSNPKPTAEIESGEKADLVLGEEGQRFYRDGDNTGRRDASGIKAEDEDTTLPKPFIKKEENWHPRSAGPNLKGSSLRGDAVDYVPSSHIKGIEVAEVQWTELSATLEDIWTRGKKVVDCTLVRAEEPEDDQEEEHGLPERQLEDRGNNWNPHAQHQHRHSRSDFSTGIEHQWADDQNGEEGELEGDEGDGEGWGYNNDGYPESGGGGPNNGMNWGPGYPIGPGHPQGPWNPEQFPMIPNTNIPDPNAQWYAAQHVAYSHSGQPSPVFSQHGEAQGPAFMGGGAPVPQAMHWVPGHMDYANAGWMYGFEPNDIGPNVNVGTTPVAEPVEETPSGGDVVSKVIVDGKLPGPVQSQQQPQPPRVQIGSIKQKRPRGGRTVKKKERRKGGSGGSGIGRNGGISVVN